MIKNKRTIVMSKDDLTVLISQKIVVIPLKMLVNNFGDIQTQKKKYSGSF